MFRRLHMLEPELLAVHVGFLAGDGTVEDVVWVPVSFRECHQGSLGGSIHSRRA